MSSQSSGRCRSFGLLLVVVLMVGPWAIGQSTPADASDAERQIESDETLEFVRMLEAWESFFERNVTLTEVRDFYGPGVPPATDPRLFSREQVEAFCGIIHRIRCVRDGKSYRIDAREVDRTPDPYQLSRQYSFAWDGFSGREMQTVDGMDASQFVYTMEPGGIVQRDFLGTGQGWWVFNRPGPLTHADVMRQHLVEGPIGRPDGRIEWRCLVPGSHPDDTVLYVAGSGDDESLRLEEIEVVYRMPREPGGSLPATIVTQSFWFDHGSRRLGPDGIVPSRFVSLVQPDCSQRAPGARCWALREHVVVEVTQRPEDLEPLFRPQPLPGARVLDARLGVSFTMGGRVIVIDQRALQTDRPTDATVITELDRWIEAGQWVEPVGPTSNAVDDPSDDPEDLESTSHDPGGSDP